MSSFELKGPVRSLSESIYLSYHFKVDGMRYREAEKSIQTGFNEWRFDSAGYLTFYRVFRQQPFQDQTDTFTFDAQHRMTEHSWWMGRRMAGRTEHKYNILGQLVSVRQYDDTGALFCETAYRYRGGLLSEERTFSRAYVPISEIHYTYDSLKRLVREECPWNPYRYVVPYVKEYFYDAAGNMAGIRYGEKEEKKGWTYRRTSDDAGRILSESTYNTADSLLKNRSFKYDFRGRLVSEQSLVGLLRQEISYTYRSNRLNTIRNRYGDVDFRTFFLKYDEWGNWVEKVEYDGINLQITTRVITYADQALKMK